MFSSIFALWENMINYLAMLGAASLILLELSREMHKRKYDFEEVI